MQSAYYQLVIHPLDAAGVVNNLYVSTAKNALYAKQGRATTNDEAARVRALFARDAAITAEYHTINGGKWNHIMDQTHIGYTSWQQPEANAMPAVTEIAVPKEPKMDVAVEGRGTELRFTPFGQRNRRIDVFNRGLGSFWYRIDTDVPWIEVTPSGGLIDKDQTVLVGVNAALLPAGAKATGTMTISGGGETRKVTVVAYGAPTGLKGFVEGDGVVAIEAEHTSRRVGSAGVKWETIPGYGRTLSGVEPFPVEFKPFVAGKGARMEYDLTTFTAGKATLEAVVGPSLAFQPGHGLRVAFAFDDATPQMVDLAPTYLSRAWETAVSDAVQKVRTEHILKPGRHVLKVWAVDPGVVIERLVLDLGGLKPSYLGPPESRRLP